ncbi:MAG: LPS-assembly protein LptD [Candidatus Omnitrophica bacterium]|nr:LPS-assembly protein LptD [Candidatus Omnitrophota bacterium]
MTKRETWNFPLKAVLMLLSVVLAGTGRGFAAVSSPASSVELNGDTVEYSVDGSLITAKGNVKIIYQDSTLTCDMVTFEQKTKNAHAKGHVRLRTKKGEVAGNELEYNFATQKGEFRQAKIFMPPLYGYTDLITKLQGDKLVMSKGYMTTSDWDDPEYRMFADQIEIYPQDKVIARNVLMKVGNVPLMYIPKISQNLQNPKPQWEVIPGYKKRWGAFLLGQWRYFGDEHLKAVVHADYRQLIGMGYGLDTAYKTPSLGNGLLRTYYLTDKSLTTTDKTDVYKIQHTRYKVEWRHQWQMDKQTNAVMQFYKLSDSRFLKDFFQREYDRDSNPQTFFLLTRTLSKGILSLRADKRVNTFTSQVERLPEVRYDMANFELGDSGLYWRNATTYSNLANEQAAPSVSRLKTMRLDTDNILSYPMKVHIFEFKPYVGQEETYYSRTHDISRSNITRAVFKTGASVSTKFYRIYEAQMNAYGLEINRLRHIITPTVSYDFQNKPTVPATTLDAFDSVDTITNIHNINFSLENKLQTKRNDKTVELLRAVLGTDFHLKEDPRKGGFDTITSNIDFRPVDWLTLYFDSGYDPRQRHWSAVNFDAYINGKGWGLDVGKRWARDADDQVTTDLHWDVNKKWTLHVFDRFDLKASKLKEQGYTVTRDLHSWTVETSLTNKKGEGSEIMLIFRLKAFPSINVGGGTGFAKRKAGQEI